MICKLGQIQLDYSKLDRLNRKRKRARKQAVRMECWETRRRIAAERIRAFVII